MSNVMYMNVALDKDAIMPVRAHELDAGLDLFTPVPVVVPAHGYEFVDTGVHVELPHGTCGHVCSKSGLNRKFGVTADGTVDEGYTGSIGVTLHNDGSSNVYFHIGDKIAQLVIQDIRRPMPVLVSEVSGGDRGDDGFGSTGR